MNGLNSRGRFRPARPGWRGAAVSCLRAEARAARRMPRGGFTLVELLITMTIISILAGVVLAGLNAARTTARVAKTKSTITKLHYLVLDMYDSYRTRRVDVASGASRARVNAIRDLMRMEMPDRWSDVWTKAGQATGQGDVLGPNPLITSQFVSALAAGYCRTYEAAWNAAKKTGLNSKEAHAELADHASAECLYMIVMAIPDAAEQFHASEIGDVDQDGLPEFIDAWGNPIRFIRWPVGFVEHESLVNLSLSGDPTGPAGRAGEESLEWDSPSDLQSGDRITQPDPFDTRGIAGGAAARDVNGDGNAQDDNSAGRTAAGYAVYPLIYSAGPDGIYDINFGSDGSSIHRYSLLTDDPESGKDQKLSVLQHFERYYAIIDPYHPMVAKNADASGNRLIYVGQPQDGEALNGSPRNGRLDHYDNVHNHRLETGRGG